MISPDVCPGRLDFEASVHKRHFVSAIVRKRLQESRSDSRAGQRERRENAIWDAFWGKFCECMHTKWLGKDPGIKMAMRRARA